MNGLLLHRPRSSAVTFAAVIAVALTAARSPAFAQSSLTYLNQGLTAWYVSADGSTVVGVEDTPTGQHTFVWKDGAKTSVSLGGGFTTPSGVSGDGSTVVGSGQLPGSGVRAFVWHVGDAAASTLLPSTNSSLANAISTDGSTIVGTEFTPAGAVGFVFQNGTASTVTFGGSFTSVDCVSANGSTVAGSTVLTGLPFDQAFVFHAGASPTLVPFSDPLPSGVTALSADGSTVVGFKVAATGVPAFVWKTSSSTPSFIDLGGGGQTNANSVSADGSVVVGDGPVGGGVFRGFAWRNGTTEVLPPPATHLHSSATLVSADGTRVVGSFSNNPANTLDYDSMDVVVWDGSNGPAFLKDLLAAAGVTVGAPRLRAPMGMSDDGAVIAGDSLLRTASGTGFINQFGSFVSVLQAQHEATPAELIGALTDKVNGLNLPKGIPTALNSKLQSALAAVTVGDNATALAALNNFIDQVKAQRGKKIPVAAADQLIADALAIIAKL